MALALPLGYTPSISKFHNIIIQILTIFNLALVCAIINKSPTPETKPMPHMFHIAKYVFYLVVIALVIFLVWFLPKYSYVQKNPGYCVALTNNLYYCGNESNIADVYGNTIDAKEKLEQAKQTYDEVDSSLNPQ